MGYVENNRVLINLDVCAMTGACAAGCPQNAIDLKDDHPYFLKECEGPCRECADNCAAEAIEIKD